MIKHPLFALWLGLMCTTCLHAQIAVDVAVDQEQFLRDEPIRIKLRIKNLSGQTLKLGGEPDWVALAVESRDGSVVTKLSDVQVPGTITIDSAQVAILVSGGDSPSARTIYGPREPIGAIERSGRDVYTGARAHNLLRNHRSVVGCIVTGRTLRTRRHDLKTAA